MISITSTERRTHGLLRLACTVTAVLVALAELPRRAGCSRHDGIRGGRTRRHRETVDEVLAVLRDKSKPTEERIRSLEQIVYGRFDLYVMSRLVLARNWKRFSEEQKGNTSRNSNNI